MTYQLASLHKTPQKEAISKIAIQNPVHINSMQRNNRQAYKCGAMDILMQREMHLKKI